MQIHKRDSASKDRDCDDHPSSKKLHILVAEDNVINQRLTVRMLERQGYSVEIANNGKETIEALHKRSFDLVLMDVQMPVMDGLETTRVIRQTQGKSFDPHIPIIAFTAHMIEECRQQCLESGMNSFVTKPFQGNELFTEIEKLVSTRNRTSGPGN